MLDFNDTNQFRELKDYWGYGVGADGTLWSRLIQKNHCVLLGPTWTQIHGGIDRDGYRLASIAIGGKRLNRRFHTLVLEGFVGQRPSSQHLCRHLDGNKLNNNISNLAWGTAKENTADARAHGTLPLGEQCTHAKLTEVDVRQIREIFRAGGTTKACLARKFGVTRRVIKLIVDRSTWNHVP